MKKYNTQALRRRWYSSEQENKVFEMVFLFPRSHGVKIIKNRLYNSQSRNPPSATNHFLLLQKAFFLNTKKPYLSNRRAPYSPTARRKHFTLATILCRITCSIIICLFREVSLKYTDTMGVWMAMCDFQGKPILQLGIEAFLSKRCLEGTIETYIYSWSS